MPTETPDKTQTRNLIFGIGLMVFSTFLFPLKDSFVKLLDGQYSAIQIVWTQFAVTSVVFFALILAREGKAALLIRAPALQILRSLFVTTGMGTFYWAITLIPLAEATAMQFIAPLVVTALSPFLLGEKVGIRRWLSVIAGFAGVLIVLQPEFGARGLFHRRHIGAVHRLLFYLEPQAGGIRRPYCVRRLFGVPRRHHGLALGAVGMDHARA
jgi:drug/metabolite transporter (DMT)-like permease